MNEEKKAELRAKNEQALKGKRPDASFFKSLDSSIKKNSAFVKKIKTLSELQPDQKGSLLPDPEDIDYVVDIASALHQLYAEFSESFISSIVKSCATQNKDTDKKELNVARLSVVLMIVTKLFITRMHDNFATINNVLKGLIQMHKKTSQTGILMPFLTEFQHDFLIGKPYDPSKCDITEQEHKQINELFMQFFDSLCDRLRSKQKEIGDEEISGEKKSSLDENTENLDKEKKKLKQWKKHYDVAKEVADILNAKIPDDIEEALQKVEDMTAKNEQLEKKDVSTENIDQFVNERTRQFYEIIPDLNQLMQEKNELENIVSIDDLLDKLPKRPPIDKVATTLAVRYLNQKTNRTKLVKKMFSVNRTSLELLPYYGRLVAILNLTYKDIGKSLVQLLEEEFNKLFEEQDQIKIETKVKNIRFLGELILFKICPEETGIEFFKKCLSQFHHHNIDVACHFLEVCGRYLYAKPTTHLTMVELVSKMMRIKDVKVLDVKYNTMIDNAYYNTVINEQEAEKQRTVYGEDDELTQYVLHLLLSELNKYNINTVLKQLRKLPYDNFEVIKNIVKSLLSHIRECAYGTIHLMASVLGGLSRYHEEIGVVIIDFLIEQIRYSLQQEYLDYIELGINQNADYFASRMKSEQKRLIDIKFLGEFYNYQLIDINVIMDVLYMLILYPTPLEPAKQDTFRLRLICTLLDTCGPYLETAADRKKVDRFLLYLQRYVLSKQYRLPVDLENMLADTLDNVKPKLKWPKSLKDVNDKIEAIEQKKPIPLPGQGTPTDLLALWPISDNDQPGELGEDEEVEEMKQLEETDLPSCNGNKSVETNDKEAEELDHELMELVNESIKERKFITNNTIMKLGTNIPKPQEMLKQSANTPTNLPQTQRITLLSKQGRSNKAHELFVGNFAKVMKKDSVTSQPPSSSNSTNNE
nr:unnamed protein product [Naegleria fowleri]